MRKHLNQDEFKTIHTNIYITQSNANIWN